MINESIFLNPLINQNTLDSFSWSPQSGILNPGELVAHVSPRETTEYTLTIQFGECIETRTVIVEVTDNRTIYLGDIFSPNGDGNNDFFFIQTADDVDVQIHEFKIYDRWGNMVFTDSNIELNNNSSGWDGYINNQKAMIGVYTYLVEYSLRGQRQIEAGPVTLIR
jgi:gliding motility-associated-like protein